MPKLVNPSAKSVKIKRALTLSAVLALSGVAHWAVARDLDQDKAQALRRSGVIQPFEGFVDRAIARYPGAALLEVELERKHGRYLYEIELLTQDKHTRELKFDAQTGELLADKEDD